MDSVALDLQPGVWIAPILLSLIVIVLVVLDVDVFVVVVFVVIVPKLEWIQ